MSGASSLWLAAAGLRALPPLLEEVFDRGRLVLPPPASLRSPAPSPRTRSYVSKPAVIARAPFGKRHLATTSPPEGSVMGGERGKSPAESPTASLLRPAS